MQRSIWTHPVDTEAGVKRGWQDALSKKKEYAVCGRWPVIGRQILQRRPVLCERAGRFSKRQLDRRMKWSVDA